MIYINDKVRISRIDDKNLQLEALEDVVSKKDKTVSQQWQWQGYYGTLEAAARGALKKMLFDTADEELALREVISHIDKAASSISSAISHTRG